MQFLRELRDRIRSGESRWLLASATSAARSFLGVLLFTGVLSLPPKAAAAQETARLRVTPESIPAMVASLQRELGSLVGLRARMLAAVRADSGRPGADAAFLQFDSAGADTIRAHVENIKFALDPIALWPDTSVLRPLRAAFTALGVWLELAEGDANPVMNDSISRARVRRFLTPPMRALLDIRSLEQRRPIDGDGEIVVPLDEIGRRLAETDRVRSTGTFAGSDGLALRRRGYLSAYLEGESNSPAFGDDGLMTPELRASLERFRAEHPATESGKAISRYLALLRSSHWRRTAAVDALLKELLP